MAKSKEGAEQVQKERDTDTLSSESLCTADARRETSEASLPSFESSQVHLKGSLPLPDSTRLWGGALMLGTSQREGTGARSARALLTRPTQVAAHPQPA